MAITTAPVLVARDRSFRDFFLETVDDAYAFCVAGDTGLSCIPVVLGAAYASYEVERAAETRRTLLAFLAHVRRARLDCPGAPTPAASALEGRGALRWLPEMESTTLQLCDRLGYTYQQAAVVLDCGELEVASTLERSRCSVTDVSHALALWNGGRPFCNRLGSWVWESSEFGTDLVPSLLAHARGCRMCSFVVENSVDPVSDLANAGPDFLPRTTRFRIIGELRRRELLADPAVGAHGAPPARHSRAGTHTIVLALSLLVLVLAGSAVFVMRRAGTGQSPGDPAQQATAESEVATRDLGGDDDTPAADVSNASPVPNFTSPPDETAAPSPAATTQPAQTTDRPLVPDRTVRFDSIDSTAEVLRPPGATPALYRITLTWWSNGDDCGVIPSFQDPRAGFEGSGQAVFENVPTGAHTIAVECRAGDHSATATEPLLLP